MKKIAPLVLLLAIVVLSAFSKNIQEGWSTLSEKNYSVQYPEEWRLDQSGQMNTKFMLFSPITGADDSFSENVNLIIEDLTGHNISLDQYVELSENQLKSVLENVNIVSSETITGDDMEFHKVVFTGAQGAFNLKFTQHYYIYSNKAFVLTLTCEANQYDNYKNIGEKICNSFRVVQD